ncbi:MAG: TonB-dependent receptor [Chitinophagaceae bacterium]|nr:TonB-dependent receptor [Chitinophagaceae bacterium]
MTFLSKMTALLIVFNLAASTILLARNDHNYGFKHNSNLPVPITGKVVDENNNPLAGVTVQVKNSDVTATTNESGNFSINAENSRAILVFSYVGYASQEVAAGSSIVIHLLRAANNDLGEVIVVGYGTQRKISVTGAVDRVGSEAIEGKPVKNVSEALQGVSPNLIIQQRSFQPATGSININIRGLGTTGNNSPLIVIDGIIGGDLNNINPNDIDNISVLKDAGAAAIYGSRSANGVILVTTKKGRRNSKPSLSYNGVYGIQTPRITFHQVHGWENAMYKNISLANSDKAPAFTDAQIQQLKDQGDGDWQLKNILNDAPQQNHNVTISGGSANSTYLMSFGYFDQNSMFDGPGYGATRYNFRLNQTTTLGKFNLSTIISYVKSQYKEPSTGAEGLIIDVTRAPLYNNFQDAQGHWLSNSTVGNNPKAILEQGGSHRANNDEVTGNFSAEYVISPAFKLRGIFGGTVNSNTEFQRQIYLQFPAGDYGKNRQVWDRDYKSLFTNTQILAEYNKAFGKSQLNVLFGGTNESFISQKSGVQKQLTDSTLGIPTTGTLVDPGTTDGSFNSLTNTTETSLNSLLARVQYSFNDKYFLEGNFRYDGSSNFPKNGRWGFFPSIGAKWRATEENFLSGYRNRVGDLMLRATYGILGNQSVDPYQYYGTYSTGTNVYNVNNIYGFNNSSVSGASHNIGNQDLTWEKAATLNLGLDATFFQRRLGFTFEYYTKTTSDILQNREDVVALFGSALPTFNISKVRSTGWEAKVTYQAKGKLFTHNFAFNIADNQNKLLALSGNVQEYEFKREEFWFVRRVGLPITVYRGYQTNGLYQTEDELTKYPKFGNTQPGLGDLKFKDQNGDGVIDSKDRVILGNPFPRYTFGFTYDVSFKGFDVAAFIQGVGKRDQLIRGELVEAYHYGFSGTMYEHQKDFWTPDNTGAKYPRIAENGSHSNDINYKIGSDIYLRNAAYARLKNLQIGYSLPTGLISRMHMQKARFYLTGQNLITVTKLKIIDPEQSEFDNRVNINSGANSARAYPTPIFYGAGPDITF